MAVFGRVSKVLCALILVATGQASAQPQTKDQQKCTTAMNKAFVKVASTLGKDICACIADGAARALPGTIESCLTADTSGKVGEAKAKTDEKFTKLCTGTSKDGSTPRLPPYGATDAATVNAAVTEKELSLIHDVFGPDLDTAITSVAANKSAAKCQQAVAMKVKKCEAAKLKAFASCKKKGLEDESAPFDGPEDLEGCMGVDPKGKIAKACDLNDLSGGKPKVDGIRKALDKKCVKKAVSLAAAFPGCAVAGSEQTHDCLDRAVECRVCLGLNRADGLERDCDVFDDGAANLSCLVIGSHQCALNPKTAGLIFDTAAFFDIFTFSGAVDIACGKVDPDSGKASCTCEVDQISPFAITGIGVACIGPAAGCPTGEISCNGGELYNSAITSTHNIGTCTSNADCATECATNCGGAGALVFDSGCEGFCRGGSSNGAACTNDAGCPGGTCNGLDGTTHGNICQCQCLDTSGDPSLPGGLHCNVGVDISVETAAPCDGADVIFRVGDRCVPFTTETAQATIVDANNMPGEQLPPGLDINSGVPLACAQLAADGTSGMIIVSSVGIFDVQMAGDIALQFLLGCE